MEQVFIACPDRITQPDDFERKLFVLRNYASHLIHSTVRQDAIGFYVASLSHRTVVYKGQLTSLQVRGYFPDLSTKRLVSAFALVHSRWCIRASLPTLFRRGNWRNPSATSHTTAKSTPCKAISTG